LLEKTNDMMTDLPVQKVSTERDSTARWWRSVFNAAQDAQIVCRADGTVQYINPKAAQFFKLEAEKAEFSIYDVLPLAVKQKLERLLRHHSARQETINSVTITTPEISNALMDLEVITLGGDSTLVTLKDAARRPRVESHMQRLITAIDATPDVFLVTGPDLRITYVNPAFQSATGYGIEEVIGRSDEFLRAPSEQEKVKTYLDHVSRGQEWSGELVNVRSNGETYQAESTISPIFDINENFMGYVVCERDITMRNQLQNALRVERDFVRSILQSLDGAIYSLDCEFRLTHANDGWHRLPAEHGGIRLTGAPEVGKALLDYVPDFARQAELLALFQEVMISGLARDNYFRAADGHHWLVKISPWINGGRVRGLICSITDQTRHHDLQNQLFQSQKMEIIGTLAAGVAHDFNNLMQVILGHTSLILMNTADGPSPLRQGLEKIDMAAVRATEITQQLLSFSRASEEKSVVLDLNKTISETSQLARRSLRSNVTIELQPASAPLPVKMDSTHASQVLLNLCVNAQDAMPNGGRLILTNSIVQISPEIAARHGNLQPGATYARCSVSDTGSGIAPDLLPRIFQPFFTTKEKGKGTGLGLSIVQRITQEAGGFADVESVLGKGTTFHLYLPLSQEKITSGSALAQATLSQGKGRILVVDDVDLVRDLAREFLGMSGFTVLTAGSGLEAIKFLETTDTPVDILFTDYNMPRMNGVDLIRQVAARWPKIKFILASGHLDDATRAQAENCKTNMILKPYDMYQVSKAIAEMLSI
jgi:PAS domain S-box-containing protein